jgi:hypothetical protein
MAEKTIVLLEVDIDAYGGLTGGRPARRKSSGSGLDTKKVRLWAIENGYSVNTRGRIEQDIIEKYKAAS